MNPYLPPELLPLLAEHLGWALLHSVWQGALIAAVLALALPFLRSAAARHAACLLALLSLVAAVAVTVEFSFSAAVLATAIGASFVPVTVIARLAEAEAPN